MFYYVVTSLTRRNARIAVDSKARKVVVMPPGLCGRPLIWVLCVRRHLQILRASVYRGVAWSADWRVCLSSWWRSHL